MDENFASAKNEVESMGLWQCGQPQCVRVVAKLTSRLSRIYARLATARNVATLWEVSKGDFMRMWARSSRIDVTNEGSVTPPPMHLEKRSMAPKVTLKADGTYA